VLKEAAGAPERRPMRLKGIDRTLANEIMRHPGGEKLALCYQCGSCTGGCPVVKLTPNYSPRQIIHKVLLGLRGEVLSDEAPWLCASCYTCQERCPQGVDIADLMMAIRSVAASEGYAPKASIEQAQTLIEHGRLISISASINQRRVASGLPEIPPASGESIKKILHTTGFVKLVSMLRSGSQ